MLLIEKDNQMGEDMLALILCERETQAHDDIELMGLYISEISIISTIVKCVFFYKKTDNVLGLIIIVHL